MPGEFPGAEVPAAGGVPGPVQRGGPHGDRAVGDGGPAGRARRGADGGDAGGAARCRRFRACRRAVLCVAAVGEPAGRAAGRGGGAGAQWWERHIVEVLRGESPDAQQQGTAPKPEYDPRLVSLTRREQAKAAELTAAGRPVTASAVKQRRRRYEAGGLAAMADGRAASRTPPEGRADQRVVEAMRQAEEVLVDCTQPLEDGAGDRAVSTGNFLSFRKERDA